MIVNPLIHRVASAVEAKKSHLYIDLRQMYEYDRKQQRRFLGELIQTHKHLFASVEPTGHGPQYRKYKITFKPEVIGL